MAHVILGVAAGASVDESLDRELLPLRGHEAHDQMQRRVAERRKCARVEIGAEAHEEFDQLAEMRAAVRLRHSHVHRSESILQ